MDHIYGIHIFRDSQLVEERFIQQLSKDTKEKLRHLVRLMVSRLDASCDKPSATYRHQEVSVHVHIKDRVVYMCTTDADANSSIVFRMLRAASNKRSSASSTNTKTTTANNVNVGLYAKKTKRLLSLKNVSIVANIIDCITNVCVSQEYTNQFDEPVELQFMFPMDAFGAVHYVEADIYGNRVVAKCMKKQIAAEVYDDAVAAGQTAALLEESQPDVCILSLGNLGPKKSATIRFEYATETKWDQTTHSSVFFLPKTVFPRYDPQQQQQQDISRLYDVSYPLSFTANVTMPNPIIDITNYSSAAEDFTFTPIGSSATENQPMTDDIYQATVSFSQRTETTADIELHILCDHSSCQSSTGSSNQLQGAYREARVWFERTPITNERFADEEYCALAVFTPIIRLPKATEPKSCEYVFIVDCSGSMSGSRIDQARKSMHLFLRSIPIGSYFNIIRFGTTSEGLYKQSSREYSENSLAEASKYIDSRIQANMGGTEILEPISIALSQKNPKPDMLRKIIILTDGDVSNSSQVIALIKDKVSPTNQNTQVFAMGIGSGASHYLVSGMAEAGRGIAVFTNNGDRLEPKVMQLLRTATEPKLTDIEIQWHNSTITTTAATTAATTTAPIKMTPKLESKLLFDGERVFFYFYFDRETAARVLQRDSTQDDEVFFTIRGTITDSDGLTDSRRVEYKVKAPVAISQQQQQQQQRLDRIIHILAARSRIRELTISEPFGNVVEELALEYGLLSRFTSFVAVSDTMAPIQGPLIREHPSYNENIEDLIKEMKEVHDVYQNLNAAREMMVENIDAILTRGESIDKLSEASASLNCTRSFRSSSSRASPSTWLADSMKSAWDFVKSAFTPSENSKAAAAAAVGVSYSREESLPTLQPQEPEMERQKQKKEQQQQQQQSQVQKQKQVNPREVFEKLVRLQSAEGSWTLNEEFCAVLGWNHKTANELIAQTVKELNNEPTAELLTTIGKLLATTAALRLLETQLAEFRDEWSLLSGKAKTWMQRNAVENVTNGSLLALCRQLDAIV